MSAEDVTPKPSHANLAKALLAAQIDMPAVEPDSENPHFKSKFVSLGHLLSKARPVLNRHGIVVAQFPAHAEDGSPTLLTMLIHESGEKIQAEAPLLLSKQDPQGQGSAITYMRRYALGAALGISDSVDDDGEAAAGNAMKRGAVAAVKDPAPASGALTFLCGGSPAVAEGVWGAIKQANAGIMPAAVADALVLAEQGARGADTPKSPSDHAADSVALGGAA